MSLVPKKLSCIIVDDNAIALMLLKQLIDLIPNLKIEAEFNSAIDANNYLVKHQIDVLFLDIEMPEMTGFDLLKSLKPAPVTILTSGSKAYLEEAYEMNVADYLVKPVLLPRLAMAINRAAELVNKKDTTFNKIEDDHVFIKENKSLRKLLIKDIYWLEAKGDYVKIHLADKSHIIHSTLKQLEEKLPVTKFFRVHRSYIIAPDKIEYIEDNIVYLNSTPIPIAEASKGALLKKLNFL